MQPAIVRLDTMLIGSAFEPARRECNLLGHALARCPPSTLEQQVLNGRCPLLDAYIALGTKLRDVTDPATLLVMSEVFRSHPFTRLQSCPTAIVAERARGASRSIDVASMFME